MKNEKYKLFLSASVLAIALVLIFGTGLTGAFTFIKKPSYSISSNLDSDIMDKSKAKIVKLQPVCKLLGSGDKIVGEDIAGKYRDEVCKLIKDENELPYSCVSGIVNTLEVHYTSKDGTCKGQQQTTILSGDYFSGITGCNLERKEENKIGRYKYEICETITNMEEPRNGDILSKSYNKGVLCCKVE